MGSTVSGEFGFYFGAGLGFWRQSWRRSRVLFAVAQFTALDGGQGFGFDFGAGFGGDKTGIARVFLSRHGGAGEQGGDGEGDGEVFHLVLLGVIGWALLPDV